MYSRVLQVSLVTAALMVTSTASSYASSDLFQSLMGKWRGKGIVTANLGGKKENIRCRLQNRESKTVGRMNVLGNCSVAGLLLPVNGWIKQKGSGNNYSAALFQSLTRLSSNNFSGKVAGKKLTLRYLGLDKDTKQPIKASITIVSKTAKSFNIDLRREDPKTKKNFAVGTIKFSKR